ncbi:MAG: hypothetical protein NXI31_08060 [bacterium]|nr:hypothetical protein [bacterium]
MCRRLLALRSRRWLWLAFLVLPFLAGFVLSYLLASHHVASRPPDDSPPKSTPQPRGTSDGPPHGGEGPAEAKGPCDQARLRIDHAPSAGRATANADFGARLAALAAAVATTQVAADRGELEAATTLDRRCGETLATILADYPDAGELTLATLRHAEPGPTPAFRRAATEVLRAECRRRADPAALVTAILERLLTGEPPHIDSIFLATNPWLDERHERTVTAFTAMAESEPARRPLAIALLRAVWRGIERRQVQTPGQLTARAMQLLHTGNRCERIVACERVLADSHRRPAALAWLRHADDPDLVRELAGRSAADLPPGAAAATLRQLAVAGTDLTAAWMTLAARASSAAIDGYFECLAAGHGTTSRREIVTGLGVANPTPEVRATLEHAADFDPDPQVQLRALLSMSATAPGHCEAACHRLLDRATVIGNPEHLAVVVFALQNVAAAGLVNATQRIGARLTNARLTSASRERLQRILAERLPPEMEGFPPGR